MGRNAASRWTVGNRNRQRGAVAVWVGAGMVAFIAAALLAIDVGRLFYAQRQLQKVASLAALSAAPAASGCSSGVATDSASVDQIVDTLVAQYSTADRPITKLVEYGSVQPSNGLYQMQPIGDLTSLDINGVRVTLTQSQPQSLLLAFMGGGTGGMLKASATAQQTPLGVLRVGAGLLNFDSTESELLNPLLTGLLGSDTALTLQAVDYNGLAAVNLSLDNLATALGVDVQDLTDPASIDLTLPELLDGLDPVIDGLLEQGVIDTVSEAVIPGALNEIYEAASSNPNPGNFPLDRILGPLLGTATAVAGQVPYINLLDLLIAAAAAGQPTENGEVKPIALPVTVGIDLDGDGVNDVATAVFIQVLEPPVLGNWGRPWPEGAEPPEFYQAPLPYYAYARSAAIRVLVRAKVQVPTDLLDDIVDLLNALLLGLVEIDPTITPIKLGVNVEVAAAAAKLDSLMCPRMGVNDGDPIAELSAKPAVAQVAIGTFSGEPEDAPPLNEEASELLGIHLTITALGGALLPPTSVDVQVNLPNGPVYAAVGPENFQDLDPVEQFTHCESEGVPLAECAGDEWRADRVEGENPQTVGSEDLLAGTVNSLLGDLNDELVVDVGLSMGECPPLPLGLPNVVCLTVKAILQPLLNGASNLVSNLVQLVLDLVSDVLTPVLSALLAVVDTILETLFDLLGLSLGTATVWMEAVAVDRPIKTSTCIPGAPLPPAGKGCADIAP